MEKVFAHDDNAQAVQDRNLTFGQALQAVKRGALIRRSGWNGKGMFVFQRPEDILRSDLAKIFKVGWSQVDGIVKMKFWK
mgnify:CR=1 FL=1